MSKGRLEAFSDGVIAILITIMVLELKTPQGFDLLALRPMIPVFLAYVLSFIVLGIYWNNHHHMFHATDRVNGAILWANLHLLFWLSLIPAVTAWIGETSSAPVPTAVYGAVLLMAGVAYYILTRTIVRHLGPHSAIAVAVGKDVKGMVSVVMYAAAIPLAFVSRWMADAIYVAVVLMWLVPDRRIESRLTQ
jgi:TMEM175 potassium channel family protein